MPFLTSHKQQAPDQALSLPPQGSSDQIYMNIPKKRSSGANQQWQRQPQHQHQHEAVSRGLYNYYTNTTGTPPSVATNNNSRAHPAREPLAISQPQHQHQSQHQYQSSHAPYIPGTFPESSSGSTTSSRSPSPDYPTYTANSTSASTLASTSTSHTSLHSTDTYTYRRPPHQGFFPPQVPTRAQPPPSPSASEYSSSSSAYTTGTSTSALIPAQTHMRPSTGTDTRLQGTWLSLGTVRLADKQRKDLYKQFNKLVRKENKEMKKERKPGRV